MSLGTIKVARSTGISGFTYAFRKTSSSGTRTPSSGTNDAAGSSVSCSDCYSFYVGSVTLSSGYTGWYAKVSGSYSECEFSDGTVYGGTSVGKAIYGSSSGNATVTLYGYQPTQYSYSVSYSANGGDTSSVPSKQTSGLTTSTSWTFTLNTTTIPTRSGYTFKGWGSTSASTSTITSVKCTSSVPDKTVYAIWEQTYTYKVVYSANGGDTSSVPSSDTYGPTTSTSHEFTLNTTTIPTRDGYVFAGWCASSGGTTAITTISCDTSTTSKTVYAMWTKTYTYKVVYNANGGDTSSVPSSDTYGPTTDTSHKFTLNYTDTPTRDGYVFKGWCASSGGTTKITTITCDTSTTSKTVYAMWAKTYTYKVAYSANGGDTSSVPSNDTYGPTTSTSHEFTLNTTTIPTREHYTFKGWGASSGATVTITTITCDTSTTSKTVYAIWEEDPKYTYTVAYSANGGSGVPSSQSYGPTYETSHEFTLDTSTTPTREEYTFQGWSVSQSGTTAITKITCSSANQNRTVYAIWAKLYSYSVSYSANGGTGAPSKQTSGLTTNTSWTFDLDGTTIPTREHYTFKGWASASGSTTLITQITCTTSVQDRTVYAVWEEDPQYTYTVTYSANGGSGAPSKESYGPTYDTSHEFTLDSSTVPTKTGYVFKGWSVSQSGTTAITKITCSSSNENRSVYAIWEERKYNFYIYYYTTDTETHYYSQSATDKTDDSFEFTIPADPSISGYKFKGWSGDGKSYTAGSKYSFGKDDYTTKSESGTTITYTKKIYASLKALIGYFYWKGSDALDGSYVKTDEDVTSAIDNSKWNEALAKIRKINTSAYVTDQNEDDPITAYYFNQFKNAVAALSGAGSVPTDKDPGSAILASDFHGDGSVKSALNSAIETYNNNL